MAFKIIRVFDDGTTRDVSYTVEHPYRDRMTAEGMAGRMNEGLPEILEVEKPNFRYEAREIEE